MWADECHVPGQTWWFFGCQRAPALALWGGDWRWTSNMKHLERVGTFVIGKQGRGDIQKERQGGGGGGQIRSAPPIITLLALWHSFRWNPDWWKTLLRVIKIVPVLFWNDPSKARNLPHLPSSQPLLFTLVSSCNGGCVSKTNTLIVLGEIKQ